MMGNDKRFFICDKKKAVRIAAALLLAIAAIIVYAGRELLAENPFETALRFEGPSHAVADADGIVLVTDGGKTRVTVLRDHKVFATINGKKETGGFFYAEHAAASGGKIYVADVKYEEGSTRVEAERVLRFSSRGRFEKVLFERTYEDDKPFQYGNIMDMRVHEGHLTFLMVSGDALELHTLTGEAPALSRSISTENAPYLCSAVYDIFADTVYAVSKDGIVYKEESGELALLSDMGQSGVIPWEVALDGGGNLYIADIASGSVVLEGQAAFHQAGGIVYRLNINESDVISFTDNEAVFLFNLDGQLLFAESEAQYGASYCAFRLCVWILAIFAGLASLYIAIRLGLWFMKKSGGDLSRYMLVIILSMSLTALIVALSLISSSVEQSERKIEYSLTQMIRSVSSFSGQIFGDDLEGINALGDYGGAEYTRIRGMLDPICFAAYEGGEYLYYVLYKSVDGQIVAVMDYEDTIGVVYPLGEFPEEYLALMDGGLTVLYESDSDAYGSWMYAVAPVFNSRGGIVGLIEMGTNLDVEELRMGRQIGEVILSTAVLLVLFLLFFAEATALADIFSQNKKENRAGRIPELIRPLTFLAFLAGSTCAAFIPQLSARLFDLSGFGGLSHSLGAALPLSAHLLFIAAASLISGALIDRFGMRFMLTAGLVTEMAGLGLTAVAVAAESYGILLAGMAVSGCGIGGVVVSGNTIPASFEDEGRRNALFSGVNVGVVSGIVMGTALGSYLAQAVGYVATFALSAVVLLPALWLGLKCATKSHGLALSAQLESIDSDGVYGSDGSGGLGGSTGLGGAKGSKGGKKTGAAHFLRDRSVFSFFLFAMFPFLTILYFKDFVFPLFVSEHGYSEVSIGQTLLFSGAISILITPSVSPVLLKRLGAKGTNILAGALFVAALLFFALVPTPRTAVITVYVLTIAGCVGLVAQGVYIAALRASRAYGAGRSMSVYSLFDNLSQTAGPLLFGAALALGYSMAGLVVGIAAAALLVLFAAVGENDKKG